VVVLKAVQQNQKQPPPMVRLPLFVYLPHCALAYGHALDGVIIHLVHSFN
jgi:hypothetical protein